MAKLLMSVLALLAAWQQPASSPLKTQTECAAESTRVWTAITPAVVKTRVEPSWPNPAFNDTRGTLILDVWIDEKGDVACVKIVRSIPLDDQAAAEAVRQWKFAPATLAGRPIAVVQEVRVQKR
jgi:TonB family protein